MGDTMRPRPDVRIRSIADGDWDGIAALEAEVYTRLGLSEGRAALESRARASPGTCFVLASGRRTAGYVLALPYPPFQSPDLARTERAAHSSRNLHLHDLVVAEDFRGRGLARRLLRHLTATARAGAYERMSLVAIGGSETFWSAQGFQGHREVPLPDGYGTDALYMSAPVPERHSGAGKTEPERRRG
ncbi:GNAT family N-acetyltransferase [Streptomyces sp. NPDC059063]|uniref:GNAT family N-acetyltransferase n=1 Tax=unclassified Streptomyces TaxID=2593676 RepID=UPI00369781CC